MEKPNAKSVVVKAPGKLMLMGEHAVVYGNPCLVTAVDRFITVKAGNNDASDNISVDSTDDRFIRSALSVFRKKYKVYAKVNLITKSEIGNYGLGSSSAVTVATVKALAQLFEINIVNQQLFNLCYRSVIQVQRKASGFDLAASIFGGTMLFDGKTKKVEKMAGGKLPLTVAFSGTKAYTVKIVEEVEKSRISRERKMQTDKIFSEISVLVQKGKEAIVKRDWILLGELFNENQTLLRMLGVSTSKIDQMVKKALEAGAYGAKLSGAGGGDCVISVVSEDKRKAVAKALSEAGAIVLDLKTGAEGLYVEN